jgi:tRNA pseudouridine13 synthase
LTDSIDSTAAPASASSSEPDVTTANHHWPIGWPASLPDTAAHGILKQVPEDFIVDELPLALPQGEGEHIWLWVEKRGANTAWVASELARYAGVRDMDVGFAGLKDRYAITRQWFSVYFPKGETPDFLALQHDEFRVMQQQRHSKKIRRGDLLGNRFELLLREIEGSQAAIDANLTAIRDRGYPNYFGAQRFGHGGANVPQGVAMLRREIRVRNANKKGLYLSAVRSWMFNQVVAARIVAGDWTTPMLGEPLTPAGETTAPMWGRGRSLATEEALAFEAKVLAPYSDVLDALEHSGLSQERRALVVKPERMSWQWQQCDDETLQLRVCFSLGAGYYATSLLQEVLTVREPDRMAAAVIDTTAAGEIP